MEKSKKIRSIVAGCLAGVCLATAGLAVATDGFKSFKKNDNIQMELPEDNGGTVIGESTGNGVKVMSAKIAKEDYAEYGISPLAETYDHVRRFLYTGPHNLPEQISPIRYFRLLLYTIQVKIK